VNLYAESSAVLSWLLGENQAGTVRSLLRDAELVLTSDLTLVECDRVLVRAFTMNEITAKNADSRRKRLRDTSARWYVMRVSGDIIDRARQPFPIEPIRTLDALHVATALVARAAVLDLEILSLDSRIRAVAQELGFTPIPRMAPE
jgi:predicted nucleic acid-binding protein